MLAAIRRTLRLAANRRHSSIVLTCGCRCTAALKWLLSLTPLYKLSLLYLFLHYQVSVSLILHVMSVFNQSAKEPRDYLSALFFQFVLLFLVLCFCNTSFHSIVPLTGCLQIWQNKIPGVFQVFQTLVVVVVVMTSPSGTAYMGGQMSRRDEDWGIPPVSESGGICLSLVIADSHFIDWGTTQGRLLLPTRSSKQLFPDNYKTWCNELTSPSIPWLSCTSTEYFV